jgi:hypothetical protein
MFKTQIFSAACLGLVALGSFAGPFDPAKVAADAKWVIHLDVDAFRKTAVGRHITEKVLKPKLENNEQIKKLNLSLNLDNISGLTAYGPEFDKNGEGVLVLSTSADVKKDLDTLVGMAAVSGNENKDVAMLQEKPFALYSFKDQVFLAPNVGKSVLVAKSRDQLELAREVVLGKKDNLTKATTLRDYPAMPDRAFFVAMAEGFNDAAEIPPQAQVLRETKGGRVVLGETDENLFLNVVFKTKDEQASTKIQQVLQGLVALVSLSQPDKEITDLASGSRISSAGKTVSVDLKFPAARAIQKFEEKHGDKAEHKAPKRVREKRAKQPPEAKKDATKEPKEPHESQEKP